MTAALDPQDERLVVTERSGDVVLIAINRPDKRNCVNEETARQLLQAMVDFEKDDTAKVGVLYGKGTDTGPYGRLIDWFLD